MVQEFMMRPARTAEEAFNQGMSKSTQLGLAANLQDMLEQKQAQRQMDMNRQINKGYGVDSIEDPARVLQKLEFEHQYGKIGGKPVQRVQDFLGQNQPESQSISKAAGLQKPSYRQLQPGEAPMLPYEDMPAGDESEMQQQPMTYQQQANQPQVAPRLPTVEGLLAAADQQKAQLANQIARYKEMNPGTENEKNADLEFNRQSQNIDRDINTKLKAIKAIQGVTKETREAERALIEKEKPARDYIDATIEKVKKIREKDADLQSIIDLSKGEGNEGKIMSALDKAFFGGQGLLFSPNLETIQKLSNNLVPGLVQQYAGSKGVILKSEAESFIRSIPTLLQTEIGRVRVAKYMMARNKLEEAEYSAMKKVQDQYESEGKPLDSKFKQKVFDSMENEYKDILEEMHQIAITDPNLPTGKVRIKANGKNWIIDQKDLESAKADGAEQLW